MTRRQRPHVLIVGGGYVGLYTALRLQRRLRPAEASITVVDEQAYMTYQPFLSEAAAGNLEPRHLVVSLRRVLRGCQVLCGSVTGVDHARRVARFAPAAGAERELSYDVLVMAPGSVVRTLPIPGLAEQGIGFKSVAEAIWLRNHVLGRLETAASVPADPLRRRLLTFVVVGGGYAGVEALAELEDMARAAMPYYRPLTPADMRWVLVEASGRILAEVSETMGRYTIDRLAERGIEVKLSTRVRSLTGGHVVLESGEGREEFDADTVVWTAGVRPHPMLGHTDLPLDGQGRLRATEFLTVEGVEDAWTAGDAAAVPDLTKPAGTTCAPNAQHAVRQARQLADNLVAALRREPLRPYRHAYLGSVASLGLHRGVAEIYGVRLRGWPAWFAHRTYHLTRMPTLNRKVRIAADWTLALFFQREFVSLGSESEPRRAFQAAAAGQAQGAGRDAERATGEPAGQPTG